MVTLAALLLFGWAALSGGFGAYALMAALQTESLFHAVQAGISLLIATVSASAGFLALIVGGLRCDSARFAPTVATDDRKEISASAPGMD